MPESKDRRRGRRRPSRVRRGGGAVGFPTRHAELEGRGPGRWLRFRARTRRRLRRWLFIGAAATVGILVIGSFALTAIPTGLGGDQSFTLADSEAEGAAIGDHRHAAVIVEVCGEDQFLPVSPGGVHSHGDGRIHIHPAHSGEAGDEANLGRFFDSMGMVVESHRIQTPTGVPYNNGDSCPNGDPGEVQVLISGEDFTETFRAYTPLDGNQVEVFFR